ncbi:hypothetical protein LCGC14_0534490 [marine sediment metagenome]|uniref:Uncharacterized protein n=1 Tax=marine sediment metagenome TaxID=412755 RepID=A0A0F9V2P0_9ZZZZ
MKLKLMGKKGQAGGFGAIPAIVISIMIGGFILTILTQISDDLGNAATSGSNTSQVAAAVGTGAVTFAGNFGTLFSLGLLAIIISLVAVFLVRQR